MQSQMYCPGNGSRYELLYDTLDSGASILCYMRTGAGGICFKFYSDVFVHYTYFIEKTNLSVPDTAALLAFTRINMAADVGLPPGYNSHGIYVGTNM